MVIVPSSGSLLFVRQADHAAMSACAAERWRVPIWLDAGLWRQFVEAVRRHDDGWEEEEAAPALDADGRPHDFRTIPARRHVPIWRRSVERAREREPFEALLVAQHGRWLYTQFPEKPSERAQEISDLLVEELDGVMEVAAATLAGGTPAERVAAEPGRLASARSLLSFLDGLSLMLLGALPVPRETEVLPFGERRERISLREDAGDICLDPWPFVGGPLTLQTKARRLDSSRFERPEELARALAGTTPFPIRRTVRPA